MLNRSKTKYLFLMGNGKYGSLDFFLLLLSRFTANFKKEEALHFDKFREILRGTLEIQAYRSVFQFHILFPLSK